MSLFGVRFELAVKFGDTATSRTQSAITSPSRVEFSNISRLDIANDSFSVVNLDINLVGDRITYSVDQTTGGTFSAGEFNGYVLSIDSENPRPIYSATIAGRTGFTGVTAADVSINSGAIQVNVAGATYANGDQLTVDVGFVFLGTSAANTLTGLRGADLLRGLVGDDTLRGGAGDDRIEGGSGDDELTGGAGADRLIGGSGADTYVYLAASDSTTTRRDVIVGFDLAGEGVGDVFDLSEIDTNPALSGDQRFEFGKASGAGALRITESGTDTVINLGTDADAAFEMSIRIIDGSVRASAYTTDDFFL